MITLRQFWVVLHKKLDVGTLQTTLRALDKNGNYVLKIEDQQLYSDALTANQAAEKFLNACNKELRNTTKFEVRSVDATLDWEVYER